VEDLTMPAAALLLSPMTDLTVTGSSYAGKAHADPAISAQAIRTRAADYLAGTDPADDVAGVPHVFQAFAALLDEGDAALNRAAPACGHRLLPSGFGAVTAGVCMRVLFSTTAGQGHFAPMLPVARALTAAGHEVAVTAPESFAASVVASGLPHLPFADPDPAEMGAAFGRLAGLSVMEANAVMVGEIFAGLDAAAALPGIHAIVQRWRPDLVVREPAEFGSLVAAAGASIPQAAIAIFVADPLADYGELIEDRLTALSRQCGASPDAAVEAWRASPLLSSVPAVLEDVAQRPVWRYHDDAIADSDVLPAWGDPAAPLVYVSFGSVAAALPWLGELYPRVITALGDLAARVLVTTGVPLDLGAPGSLPHNVRVETWRAQAGLMPSAAVVVGHGGFGTSMIAARAGVPQVFAPLFSVDQFVTAERLSRFGAARTVPGLPQATHELLPAVADVLTNPDYRRAADTLRGDIAALPSVGTVVSALEQHAAAR
jgi:UDP:flavonoid glycosyltransferase YjiC (YdhE family)